MSNEYGAIPLTIANDVGSNLKKKMGSLTGFAPVDWAETINKLGNKLPERTVSGAVCSFADGADDVPMTEVKANITAVQAGSGDPSPSNVRAISGFAECDVVHTKKNLWGGEKMADDVVSAVNNSSRAYKGEDTNGKYLAISAGNGLDVPWFTSFKENTRYTLILKASKSNNARSSNIRFYYTDDSTSAITFPENPVSGTVYTIVATSTAGKTLKRIEGIYHSGITYVYYEQSGLFEGVLTASDYESYAGETIPVWIGGVNIWDEQWEVGGYNNSTGEPYANTDRIRSKANDYIHITPSTTYYFKSTATAYMFFYKEDKTFIRYEEVTKDTTFTTPSNAYYMRFRMAAGYGVTYNNNISINYPATETGYNACRYIYGGELNLTTGVLTVTHGYIASYDGETINEPWISSIDKYVAGNSPSTGAQVVYPLTTPTTIQLTPEEVRSFLGTNNLWANTGDSEVTYFAQPNVPEEVLYKGQISTTSDYATANFTESVEDDEEILVKVYCPARSAVDYKVIKVSDIGNGLNVGFSLHTTVNCTITKTSIASYQYSGDYYDIYADVLAYDSAIFN